MPSTEAADLSNMSLMSFILCEGFWPCSRKTSPFLQMSLVLALTLALALHEDCFLSYKA